MTPNERTRRITDGAVIAAIYAVFLLASRFVGGLLENWLYFLLPIPLTVYGYRYSFRETVVVGISVLAVGFLCVGNPLSVLFYVLPGILCGTVFPLVIKKRIHTGIEVLFAGFFSLVVNLLVSVLFAGLFDYDIVEDTLMFTDEMIQILESFGFSSLSQSLIRALMVSLIPSVLIVSALLEGIVVTLLTHLLLIRLKLEESWRRKPTSGIERLHPAVGVGYLAIFALMILSLSYVQTEQTPVFVLCSVCLNLGIVYSVFMIYQGLFLIGKWAAYTHRRGLYILAAASVLVFPFFVIFVGVAQNLAHLSLRITGKNDPEQP